MKCKLIGIFTVFWIFCSAAAPTAAPAQKEGGPPDQKTPQKLTLVQAAMCEGIKDYVPQNKAVVFSVAIGKVLCFTSFDPVPEKTVIYHNWFLRDRLITKIGLSLQPPRWSTFSSIQLREADKGPWRVVVTDQDGHVLDELRFSITD